MAEPEEIISRIEEFSKREKRLRRTEGVGHGRRDLTADRRGEISD